MLDDWTRSRLSNGITRPISPGTAMRRHRISRIWLLGSLAFLFATALFPGQALAIWYTIDGPLTAEGVQDTEYCSGRVLSITAVPAEITEDDSVHCLAGDCSLAGMDVIAFRLAVGGNVDLTFAGLTFQGAGRVAGLGFLEGDENPPNSHSCCGNGASGTFVYGNGTPEGPNLPAGSTSARLVVAFPSGSVVAGEDVLASLGGYGSGHSYKTCPPEGRMSAFALGAEIPLRRIQDLEADLVAYDPLFPVVQRRIGSNGKIIWDPALYDDPGAPRHGVVADGVTKLILRYKTNSGAPVTFRLLGGAGLGTLSPINAGSGYTELTMRPRRELDDAFYVTLVYHAPDATEGGIEAGANSAAFAIDTEQHPGAPETHAGFRVYRPPVLLVHGLWDDAGGWDTFAPALEDEGFDVHRVSFPNADSFDPRQKFARNRPARAVARAIRDRVLPAYRAAGIAASQLDVVSHSMGGLVVRALTRTVDADYARLENYLAGDVRHHVSIGTPHDGTPLANLAFDNACTLGAPNVFRPFGMGDTLSGAVADMRQGGTVLTDMNWSRRFIVPTHTVGSTLSPLDRVILGEVLFRVFKGLDAVEECGVSFEELAPLTDPDNLFGGENDGIVPISSQIAGRYAGTAEVVVPDVVHSSVLLWALERHQRTSPVVIEHVTRTLTEGIAFRTLH